MSCNILQTVLALCWHCLPILTFFSRLKILNEDNSLILYRLHVLRKQQTEAGLIICEETLIGGSNDIHITCRCFLSLGSISD